MTKTKKGEVSIDAEIKALKQKKFEVGNNVTAHLGSGKRSGVITEIEEPEGKSPMIVFEGTNEKGETKTYRNRPTLVEQD